MSKYRKISPYIWNDKKFNALDDQSKLLFLFLLTHPHLTALGAMRASSHGLAEELKWNTTTFETALQSLCKKNMLKHDRQACFLWLPNFLNYNKPENPNVIKSWGRWLEYLPECELKDQLIQGVVELSQHLGEVFTEALPQAFVQASGKLLGKPLESVAKSLLKTSRKGMPNHEHEHEHERDICRVNDLTQPRLIPNNNRNQAAIVFQYWQNTLNHPNAKLDKRRRNKIQSALKLGFTIDQLKSAIDGCAQSDFHQGANDRNQRYDDINLILKDAEHIEKFIAIANISNQPAKNLMKGAI